MSDMKLYKILETFDKLESANDKLTPYVAEEGDAEGAAERIHARVEARKGNEEVEETQTKVQTMGNKVRVTTDGDTTEFDDTETAAAMMGSKDDENQFATEAVSDDDGDWAYDNKKDKDLDDKADEEDEKEEKQLDEAADEDAEEVTEEVVDEAADEAEVVDEWAPEVSQDQDWGDDEYIDGYAYPKNSDIGYTETDPDGTWGNGHTSIGVDLKNRVTGEKRHASGIAYLDSPEAYDLEQIWNDADDEVTEALGHIDDYDMQYMTSIAGDDDTEFSTFDSENEAHRKRLQRGTPVVLSPELFKDGEREGNRRGKFVNISSSGFRGKVIRDCDAQIVTVNLDDIVSADITNNSVYEQYNIDFDAMLAEDITMTQTTNLEQPENDTTTVTAVGPDAGEELAAMMANAGLSDSGPLDAGPVDQGEPEAVAAQEPGMQDMMSIVGEPAVQEDGWEDDDFDDMSLSATGPSDSDLDHIEAEPDFEKELNEDHLQHLSRDIGLAIANGHDIYDAMTSPEVSEKDRNILKAEFEEIKNELSNSEFASQPGHHPDDDFAAYDESAFETMAQRIYDMYSDNSEDNTGGMFGKNPLDDFPDLNITTEEGERDIEHANTPGERTAGVDMVTHGTSGGLNRAKNMFRKEYPGDNPMAVTEGDEETDKTKCNDCGELYDPSMDECPSCVAEKEDKVEESSDPYFVNEHEDVDDFLSLYKEFSIRGEKK